MIQSPKQKRHVPQNAHRRINKLQHSKLNRMKNILKAILSIIAAVLVVAGVWAMSAPKHNSQKSNLTNYYYHYTSNSTNLNDYKLQANWQIVSSPTEPGCDGEEMPCVVQSTASSIPLFVNTITQISDVTANTVTWKDAEE